MTHCSRLQAFALFLKLYSFFLGGWVIPRRLNFMCWRFGICNRQSVPKRRQIKFRRWGITQKKECYNELVKWE